MCGFFTYKYLNQILFLGQIAFISLSIPLLKTEEGPYFEGVIFFTRKVHSYSFQNFNNIEKDFFYILSNKITFN